MRVTKIALVGAVALFASLSSESRAHAQEVAHQTETVYEGPNRALFWSGVVALGVPYAMGSVVAFDSSHRGDDKLYIPVAGPWLDFTERGGCPVAASNCTTESVNKALLIGDGVFQAVGTLSLVGAFLTPERVVWRERNVSQRAQLRVAPMTGRNGTGLTVLGSF